MKQYYIKTRISNKLVGKPYETSESAWKALQLLPKMDYFIQCSPDAIAAYKERTRDVLTD